MSKAKDKKTQTAGKGKDVEAATYRPTPETEAAVQASAEAPSTPAPCLEKCPACGSPTEAIRDFRSDSSTEGEILADAWACGAEGCPCYGGHVGGPLPSEPHGYTVATNAEDTGLCFTCGLAANESIHGPSAVSTEAAGPTIDQTEDLSDLPEALQLAIVCFGLKRADVLDHRLTEDGVVLVTRGGRKLNWPGDEHKAITLTPEEKDGVARRDFPPANLFGKKG
jgi:hypothetical protein